LPEALQPHILVSNPPYIDADDPHLTAGDLRFEPLSALRAADNGLSDLRTLSTQAFLYLSDGGWVLFEHGYNQGAAVREMLQVSGFTIIKTLQDIGGQDRVTMGKKPEVDGHE
jgi:release factor glutamine methyltransferase